MRKADFLRVIQQAGLRRIDRDQAPAATVVLHESLLRHGVPCHLVFRRAPLVQCVMDVAGPMRVSSSATVAGIVIASGFVLNARGLDPVQDFCSTAASSIAYRRWSREMQFGYLAAEKVQAARNAFQRVIDMAVCQVVLDNATRGAFGEVALSRL